MSNQILKEFLVAVGMKFDEAGFKRASTAMERVEKQVDEHEQKDKARLTAEQRRVEARKRNADSLMAAFGGVATAAAAAATVVTAAMVKMTGGMDQFHFLSQRTGASVNNIKGLSYAFSQVGSSAESAVQAIESFAKARRTNPGINAMLRGYGVDTRGDSVDVLMRGVDAIQSKHPYYAGAQVAELLGISEEQFETLSRYKKEIKEYREEIAKTQRALNVNSDESARAAATVQRAFGSLTATLGVLLEKLYSALAPTLERIVKGFKDWLAANPEKVERVMQGIGHAVEATAGFLGKLGDWLGSEENQKKLAEFWDTFSKKVSETVKTLRELIETLVKIAKYLGIDKSSDPIGTLASRALGNQPQVAEGDTSQGTTYTPLLQRGWNAVKRTLGFGGGGGAVDKTPLGPVPQGLLDNIARAEGTYRTGYNTSLAHGRFLPGGKEQDLSGKSLREILQLGRYMRGQPGNPNSSALGRYQIVGSTLKAAAAALDMDLDKTKFDAETQDKMAHWIARRQGLGAWEGFKSHPAERAAAAAALARRDQSGGARPAPAPTAPMPRASTAPMSPGTFNVDDYLRVDHGAIYGGSTDNSKRVDMKNGDTHVHITTSGDATATANSFKRAAGDVNAMRLRDVQTAIR